MKGPRRPGPNPERFPRADEWYYTQEGRGHGPVSEARLRQLLKSRQLRPNDIIWQEGSNEKVRVEDVLAAQEGPEEAPAAPPAPAEAAAPAVPPTEPDRPRDVAASPPAGPAGAPRDWREDVRQGALPPRRAPAPAAEAEQQPLPEPAPPAAADADLTAAAGAVIPGPPAPEPAADRPAAAAAPPGQAPRNLALLASFALSACALVLALIAIALHFLK